MIEKDGVDDWKVYFYVPTYKRTLQTLRLLARAFGKSRIAEVREEPRLREQDFGILSFSEMQERSCSMALVFGKIGMLVYSDDVEYPTSLLV